MPSLPFLEDYVKTLLFEEIFYFDAQQSIIFYKQQQLRRSRLRHVLLRRSEGHFQRNVTERMQALLVPSLAIQSNDKSISLDCVGSQAP